MKKAEHSYVLILQTRKLSQRNRKDIVIIKIFSPEMKDLKLPNKWI